MMLKRIDNIKKAGPEILKEFKKNKRYHTATKKITDFESYSGKEFGPDLMANKEFEMVVRYGLSLYRQSKTNEVGLNDDLWREIAIWERKGALCMHNAIIVYKLLLENNVFSPNAMKYNQGLYYHKTREDYKLAGILGKEHVGIHAWLTVKGCVVDLTIGQQDYFFDFGNNPFILGKVPDGLLLKGAPEQKKIVEEYVKDFAKALNLTPDEWVARHVGYYKDFEAGFLKNQH